MTVTPRSTASQAPRSASPRSERPRVSLSPRFTSADLEAFPDIEGIRYEIIDGELYVSKQPRWEHQHAGGRVYFVLLAWSDETGLGLPLTVPGLIFAEDDDVAPDVVWISRERLARGTDRAGHLTVAPELVVEVLSFGAANERRDRVAKLDLYSRRGVDEYWIVDWRRRTVDVYRRREATLTLIATLQDGAELTSPLLPGFACPVISLWPPAL